MPRERLYSSHNLTEARILESRLRGLGYPISFRYGRGGSFWLPLGGPYEIWIDDAEKLDRAEIREQIRDFLTPSPLTPEDEERIAAMPRQDEDSELPYWMVLVAFALLFALAWFLLLWLPRYF